MQSQFSTLHDQHRQTLLKELFGFMPWLLVANRTLPKNGAMSCLEVILPESAKINFLALQEDGQAFGSTARTISTSTLRASSEFCTSCKKLMRIPFMPSAVFRRR
jgi:hypothetical protein